MLDRDDVPATATDDGTRSTHSPAARRHDAVRTDLVRVALFLLGYIAVLLAASIPKGMVPPAFADVTWGTLASLGIVRLTRLVGRRQGSRSSARNMSVNAVQLLAGIVLGFAVYALVLAAISTTFGPLRVSFTAAPSLLASVLTIVGFLALACMEELGFRGYPLRMLTSVLGERIAVFVVSILFAASHFLFGWSWQSILLGVLPSGILFGAAAVASGGLAMPIGVHMALNVAQWIVGEKARPGFFTLTIDADHAVLGANVTPFVGAIIPVVVAFALWRWYPRAARPTAAWRVHGIHIE